MQIAQWGSGLALIAGIAAFAVPALADTELKAAVTLATNREMSQAFVKFFIEPLNQKAKGHFQVRFLGGPEVMPPDKQAAAVGRGALDLTHSPAAYYAGQVPEANLVLVSNMTPAEARKSGAFAMLDAVHQQKMNVKFLAWGDSAGAFNTYLTKKPIENADGTISLKGFKLRSTATYRPLFEYLGATPISMPSGDIFTGLQRGVIQGFGSPSSGLVPLGVKGLVKYRIDPAYYRINNYVLLNLDKWKALPQSAKDIVDGIARSYEEESSKFYLAAAHDDEKALKDGGMEILQLKGKAAASYVAAANDAIVKRISDQIGAPAAREIAAKLTK